MTRRCVEGSVRVESAETTLQLSWGNIVHVVFFSLVWPVAHRRALHALPTSQFTSTFC